MSSETAQTIRDTIDRSMKLLTPRADGAIASFVFAPGLPVFTGHFPGRPMVPGIFQIEIVRCVAERTIMRECRIVSIRRAKFTRPVLPGEVLAVEQTLTEHEGLIRATAALSVGGQPSAKIEMTFRPMQCR